MVRFNKVTGGIVAALGLAYGTGAMAAIPEPGAVADAYLLIDNFTLLAGNGAGKSATPLDIFDPVANPTGTVIITSAQTTAEVSAQLGAGTPTTDDDAGGIAYAFTLGVSEGVGFVPETLITGNPTGNWAGSYTASSGNALNPLTPDHVPVHNQVSLVDYNTAGKASGNQNLTTEFFLQVGGAGQLFEMSFDADGFLRAALGQDGINATASYSWSAKVTDLDTGLVILDWSPNGITVPTIAGVSENGLLLTEGACVAAGECTEYSDGFKLTDTVGLNSANDLVVDKLAAFFEIELFLNPGRYSFTIAHQTNVNAQIAAVPEPGTLALLGAGLIGLGARRRKA